MVDKHGPCEDRTVPAMFDMTGRVVIITGGAGLLGRRHAAAVGECGARPVLLDLNGAAAEAAAAELRDRHGIAAVGLSCDITSLPQVESALAAVLERTGRVDGLINNAANNPKVEGGGLAARPWSRLENFPLDVWQQDIQVGLTGAFLCARVFGSEMARRGGGAILNIASDLAAIAPDQRLYRVPDRPDDEQPVKPVTYSVVKAGLAGLTRYLATYWAEQSVRCNALLPGGVYAGQDDAFVQRLSRLIPMGRMAQPDEYKAAVAFLVSDASSYMTGSLLSVDGGRTCW